MTANVLGIDVGGTTIKGARFADDWTVEAEVVTPTPATAAALTEAVVETAASLRTGDTVAVGLTAPGVVDRVAGIARYAVNVAWRDEPIRDVLAETTRLPVALEHDVTAAALAEADDPDDDVLFVSLGTGIAGVHVRGGTAERGATGGAGEIGHIPVHPEGETCVCGQIGCLEAYASASAIARRYATRAGSALTAEQIVGRLGADAHADAVWAEAVEALALACATDTMLNDPATIVIGGGLADAGDALLVPLRAELARRLVWRSAPPVMPARLGARAGRIGAARLAWQLAGVRPARTTEGVR